MKRYELYIRKKGIVNTKEFFNQIYSLIFDNTSTEFYFKKKTILEEIDAIELQNSFDEYNGKQSIAGRLHTSNKRSENIMLEWYFTNPDYNFSDRLYFIRLEAPEEKLELIEKINAKIEEDRNIEKWIKEI